MSDDPMVKVVARVLAQREYGKPEGPFAASVAHQLDVHWRRWEAEATEIVEAIRAAYRGSTGKAEPPPGWSAEGEG